MSDITSEWIKQVESQGGDECGNCTVWRILRGRTIEECPHCGDDAFDIDAIANTMDQLP